MERTQKRWWRWIWVGLWAVSLALLGSGHPMSLATSPTGYVWDLPKWVPRPRMPADNPMTLAKVNLGRHLFYEKRLSINQTVSCGSCHIQSLAFTDGKALAQGATGEIHPRNSMSLTNVAYLPVLTWANPLQTRLEDQALVPLFGEHPVEMGMAGREQEMISMLKQDPQYQNFFPEAFPEVNDPFTIHHLVQAIATFERTLISVNSPYDQYRYGGDTTAISAAAKRGEALFQSERLECFHCHSGFNFSDSLIHEQLAFQEIAFHNTGLYNLKGQGLYPYPNQGVYEISHKPADMGRFRTPTLRNIALTAPYMHDGSLSTLDDVIDHYSAGGQTIHTGPYAGVGSQNPFKSTFVKGFKLTSQERQDLVAFLESLTDPTFITNPLFSEPDQSS